MNSDECRDGIERHLWLTWCTVLEKEGPGGQMTPPSGCLFGYWLLTSAMVAGPLLSGHIEEMEVLHLQVTEEGWLL